MAMLTVSKVLARRGPLTSGDWLQLLEERRCLLKEHLRDMTLKTVGEIPFIHDYFGYHPLKRYAETVRLVGNSHFNLDTRGIFPPSNGLGTLVAKHERLENRRSVERFWGLTRGGVWISIETHVISSMKPYKYPGRTEEVAEAVTVAIEECTPEEICAFYVCTPKYLWERLGEAVYEWATHRRHLLAHAEAVACVVEAEKMLLQLVPK
jgi:hypothetical protein